MSHPQISDYPCTDDPSGDDDVEDQFGSDFHFNGDEVDPEQRLCLSPDFLMDEVNPGHQEDDRDEWSNPPSDHSNAFYEWWMHRHPKPRSPTPEGLIDDNSLPPASPRPSTPADSKNEHEDENEEVAPIHREHITRNEIYQQDDGDDSNDEEARIEALRCEQESIPGLPPAFYEHPVLRNIYVGVFINAAFNHATHEAVKTELETHYSTLKSCETLGDIEIPGLDKMARTLRSVERRLGVRADDYIKYHFLCPLCWQLYQPEQLEELASPTCTREYCEGIVYQERRLSGRTKRMPMKLLPTCPLIPQIQRLLMREGTLEEWQRWRQPEDHPGPAPPIPADEWHTDPDKPMTDIFDGSGWREVRAGEQRWCSGEPAWDVEDVDVHDFNQRFVSLELGLMLMINIDWYVESCFINSLLIYNHTRFSSTKNGKHSSGAVYVTICNGPREKRCHREETILACMIPGPHEPSNEELNSCLQPLVDDILKLESG